MYTIQFFKHYGLLKYTEKVVLSLYYMRSFQNEFYDLAMSVDKQNIAVKYFLEICN